MSPITFIIIMILACLIGAIVVRLGDDTVEVGPQTKNAKFIAFLFSFVVAALLLFSTSGRYGVSLHLFSLAVALTALGGATLTDLRERTINGFWLFVAAAIITLSEMIAFTFEDKVTTALVRPFLGMVITGGLAGLMWLGGNGFSILRRGEVDSLTGRRVEDWGLGDVYVMLPVGALLGPLAGSIVFISSVFVNGLLIALPILVFDLIRRQRLFSRHIPQLPGLSLALCLVLLSNGQMW